MNQLPNEPANRTFRIGATILSVVTVVVGMSVLRECQRESSEHGQVQQANVKTWVWIGTRLYEDVQVLDKGNDYVRFRTRDGEVIEQHGTFRIETKRDD